ncbi:hypothetical protein Q7P37_009926 [Cladosporium fusiforme]
MYGQRFVSEQTANGVNEAKLREWMKMLDDFRGQLLALLYEHIIGSTSYHVVNTSNTVRKSANDALEDTKAISPEGSGDEHDDASDDDTYNTGHDTGDADDEEAMYDDSTEDVVPNTEGTADSFRIDHTRGEHRLHPKEFLRRTTAAGFNGTQAIGMLQHAYTLDFGSRRARSRHCKEEDGLIPTFHLDMIAIVGRPMKVIVHRSARFFDNVTISFADWRAPYRAKHVEGGIGFDLCHRTFRIACGASREAWYIVMHPRLAISEFEPSQAQVEASIKDSALEERHARFLAEYIKEVFLGEDLVGEGVEACWRLDQRRSQNITFNKWTSFQHRFMQGWNEHVAAHTTDEFWTENRPAFHAYDYGANIALDVTEELQGLRNEQPIQDAADEYASDFGEPMPSYSPQASPEPLTPSDAAEGESSFHTEGLQNLRTELEAKFDLKNIWSMSYALAVDLNCLDGDTIGTDTTLQGSRCMLADRNAIAREFSRQRDWIFYPVAFSPVYGNFTSSKPPDFLNRNVLTVMRNNLNIRNEGVDALSCGYFQAYSNVKRSFRHSPDDLLAKKSLTTAVLALPDSEIPSHHVRTKRQKLNEQMRGMRTPENRDQSRPFAREAQRVRAAIEGEDFAFRMEQLMRFYLKEPHQYRQVLHTFLPEVYPGVLEGFSALFDKAMSSLQDKSELVDVAKGNIAISEAAAALDRLGSYLFSGSAKVVGNSVFRRLGTTDSLRYGGWPYIDPGLLNVQDDTATIHRARWPRRKDGQPALLHPAVLEFYYGKHVAAARQSNAWLHDFRGLEVAGRNNATSLLEDIFRHMWIPQTVDFVTRASGSALNKRQRTTDIKRIQVEAISRQIEQWSQSTRPFSWAQYSQILPALTEGGGKECMAAKSRRDVAKELYEAVKGDSEKARRRWAGRRAPWLSVLESVIRGTDVKVVSGEQWVGAISAAMLESYVEAMPGASRGKLTSRAVVRLVGMTPSKALLATRPGTLKRAAVEASENAKRPRLQRRIDFGCEIPFTKIPQLVDEGLRAQDKQFEKGDGGIREHYCTARHCLDACLGDPLCDLMLMYTLTLASCSVTPTVIDERFDVGKKKDDKVIPLVEGGDNGGVMSVPEMTKKIEHKGVNNRLLMKLGWIESIRGSRKNPRNSDMRLVDRSKLMQMYRELVRSRRDAAHFIGHVFRSREEVWVESIQVQIRAPTSLSSDDGQLQRTPRTYQIR